MKELYNGSKNDEYYTPLYAVEIISRYLPVNSTILCPFDTENSNFVKYLKSDGGGAHNVINTHLSKGDYLKDFFTYTEQDMKELKIDYIISNPPFSLKTDVLLKLEKLNTNFAMLLPIAQMLETSKRQELYRKIDLQVLHPDKRIKFYNQNMSIAGCPTFTSGYLCRNVLPKNLVFDTFKKELKIKGE